MTRDTNGQGYGQYSRRHVLKMAGIGTAAGFAGSAGARQGSPTQITYYDRDQFGQQYANAFNDGQNDVQVSFQFGGTGGEAGVYRSFIQGIRAGSAPEVVGTDMIVRNSFIEQEYLREISDLASEVDYRDDFYDALDPLFIEYDGTAYSMPFWIDASNYYYNKQHFRDAGLDPENPPQTWSEFRSAAETLSSDGQPAVGLNGIGGSSFLWLPWVWAGNGRFIDDNDECAIDEEPGVQALEFWKGMADDGLCTDPVTTEWTNMRNMFATEEISIVFDGVGLVGTISETNPDLFSRVGNNPFPRPEGGEHAGMTGGNSIAISSTVEEGSDALSAAEQFVRWVNTEEGMRTTFEVGSIPGRRSGFDLDVANQEDTGPLYQGMADVLSASNSRMLVHPQGAEAKAEYLNPNLEACYGGNKSPQQALSDAAEAINNNLLNQ